MTSLADQVALVARATRGGARDRRAAGRCRSDRLRHRQDNPFSAVGDEPAGDDRGDCGSGRRGRRPRDRRPGRPSRARSGVCPGDSHRERAGSPARPGEQHLGRHQMEWNKSVWESSLDYGPRTLRLAVDTHAITSHFALPLLIRIPGGLVVELTDGPDDYKATNYGVSFFYDLAKASVSRMAFALAHELRRPHRATVVSLTPGWLRSEAMLEAYGVTNPPGATRRRERPTSPSPRAPRSSVEQWRRARKTPTCRAGTERRCPAGSWRKSTASAISTAASPDAWRYVREVQDAGKPADLTGYR